MKLHPDKRSCKNIKELQFSIAVIAFHGGQVFGRILLLGKHYACIADYLDPYFGHNRSGFTAGIDLDPYFGHQRSGDFGLLTLIHISDIREVEISGSDLELNFDEKHALSKSIPASNSFYLNDAD